MAVLSAALKMLLATALIGGLNAIVWFLLIDRLASFSYAVLLDVGLTTSLLGCLGAILWFIFTPRPANFPPGPRKIPLIGNLEIFVSSGSHLGERLRLLGRKYGEVVGLFVGKVTMVSLESYEVMKEAFSKEVFSARPSNMRSELRADGRRAGLVYSEGPIWSELRRFSLKNLRDLGFGKKSLESAVLEEVEELVERLQKTSGKAVTISSELSIALFNVMWQVIAGTRYSQDDPFLGKLAAMVKADYHLSTTNRLIETIPFMNRLFPNLTVAKQMKRKAHMLREFFTEIIEEHKKTYDDSCMRDFIDIFLREMSQHEEQESSAYNEFQLVIMLMDLFDAGIETTTTTILWAILLLGLHPDVQTKLQQELDDVIGRERPPSLEDKHKLPYTEAVIYEVQRFGCTAPVSTPHRVVEDAELRGHQIPRNATVIANLWSVMRDERYWGDPDVFRPERFIASDGRAKKDERLVAFSIGKRQCPGSSMAMVELFLFISRMFQKLRFSFPSDKPLPTTDTNTGQTLTPRPYTFIATIRN